MKIAVKILFSFIIAIIFFFKPQNFAYAFQNCALIEPRPTSFPLATGFNQIVIEASFPQNPPNPASPNDYRMTIENPPALIGDGRMLYVSSIAQNGSKFQFTLNGIDVPKERSGVVVELFKNSSVTDGVCRFYIPFQQSTGTGNQCVLSSPRLPLVSNSPYREYVFTVNDDRFTDGTYYKTELYVNRLTGNPSATIIANNKTISFHTDESGNFASGVNIGYAYLIIKDQSGSQQFCNIPIPFVEQGTLTPRGEVIRINDICNNDSSGRCQECFSTNDTWTAFGCIATHDLTATITWFVRSAVFIASGIAFLLMAFGAFQIITSSGDPKKSQAGSEVITSALSGLLFIILSVFLLKLIGVDILKIPGFGS